MRGGLRFVLAGALAAVAGLMGCGEIQAAQEGIRIVSSDAYGLVMELRLPDFTIEEVQGRDGVYQQVLLPGWASTTEVGRPRLPVGAALVQAPESGAIAVDVLEDEQEVLTGTNSTTASSIPWP